MERLKDIHGNNIYNKNKTYRARQTYPTQSANRKIGWGYKRHLGWRWNRKNHLNGHYEAVDMCNGVIAHQKTKLCKMLNVYGVRT